MSDRAAALNGDGISIVIEIERDAGEVVTSRGSNDAVKDSVLIGDSKRAVRNAPDVDR